jgi:hypothetical protein
MDFNDGSHPLNFSASDWFYMKSDCKKIDCSKSENAKNPCCLNETAVKDLKDQTNDFGASKMQYDDAKFLYNRELLFMVNILVGLGMLCYYIYVNQSVFPSPSIAVSSIGNIGESFSRLTSSVKSRLSMRPSLPVPVPAK